MKRKREKTERLKKHVDSRIQFQKHRRIPAHRVTGNILALKFIQSGSIIHSSGVAAFSGAPDSSRIAENGSELDEIDEEMLSRSRNLLVSSLILYCCLRIGEIMMTLDEAKKN